MEKRIKMPVADRAKQFMPFAVLRGYEKMINETRTEKIEKRETTIEQERILNEKITRIKKHDVIKIVYYDDGAYVSTKGAVTAIDLTLKEIAIVKKRISFEDIWEID